MNELTPMPEWQVWLMDVAPTVSTLYTWILMGAGFVVSVLLARATQRSGYYLVAVFFLSPLFHWGAREVQYRMHREAMDAYAAEQNRLLQSGDIIPVVNRTVAFPLFETLLVIGLGMVLRAQRRPNQPAQHNAGSRPSSGDSPASETPSAPAPRG